MSGEFSDHIIVFCVGRLLSKSDIHNILKITAINANIDLCYVYYLVSNLTTAKSFSKYEKEYLYRTLSQVADLLSSMRFTFLSSTHKWPFTNVMLVSATTLMLRLPLGYTFGRLILRLIFSNTSLWNSIPF